MTAGVVPSYAVATARQVSPDDSDRTVATMRFVAPARVRRSTVNDPLGARVTRIPRKNLVPLRSSVTRQRRPTTGT